jgi:hypothetical protein
MTTSSGFDVESMIYDNFKKKCGALILHTTSHERVVVPHMLWNSSARVSGSFPLL